MKIKHLMCRTMRILFVLLFLFTFAFESKASALTITLGDYYYIASAIDTNQVLDVSGGSHHDGANIQLYQRNGTDAQLFKFVKSGDGYYSIINKGSGKALDVQGGRTESGTNVQLYTQNNTQAQQWKLYYAYGSNENVSIMARCGKFLDACGGNTSNGTNIWIYDGNNTAAQAFKLIPYINTTYKIVTLDFNDFDSWKKQIELAERSVVPLGNNFVLNPSGNKFYTGEIITDITVLEWKSVDVKIPLVGTGDLYRWESVDLPSKLRFKLHKHSNDVNMWFTISGINFWQQCECGYRDEWSWDVPWPDFATEGTDAQTTKSVINTIKPVHQVLYTVQ